ncbi:MAG TPA: hypothetical protein VFR48_08260 [Solirubrobacteraceae bacterium]|nr:hypothetical protein [Solirubrobacteraceae bacterium]
MRERIAVLLSLAVVVLLAVTGPARAAGPCAHAKALSKAHYYAEAEHEYKALLGLASCAKPALVIRARKQAEKQAAKARPQPEEQLLQARRLQVAGFDEEARKLVKEAVQQAPVAVPSQLREPDQQLGWWRELLGSAGPPARTALEIVIVGAGVVLLLLLIVTGLNALRLRFVPSARLAGFSGSADATLAPVLSAALSAMLSRMSDESPGRALMWQSGTEPKFELPASITEAIPQAGLLTGLVQMIDKLLYRKLFIVSGTVHPPHPNRGAGVTLLVTNRNGSRSEQVTVWEEDFVLKEAGAKAEAAVRYERLILPVAVWLAYCPMLAPKRRRLPAQLLPQRRLQSPLGAHDWRSYALFALGELVPTAEQQRHLYELALDRDSANIGARLNLAALLMQRPAGQVSPTGERAEIASGRSEGWKERLDEAGVHLGAIDESPAAAGQPIWYRARYMEAVRCLYLDEGVAALQIVSQLSSEMQDNRRSPRLNGLIEALEQPLEVVERSAQLLATGLPVSVADLRSGWLTEDGEYNLACLWARYAGTLENEERAKATVQAVIALRRAIARGHDSATEALTDPAFDPIREDPAFKAIVTVAPVAAEPDKPTRYAVTLDAGPTLSKLVGRRS